jgi:hypothetical protein
MGIAEQFVSGGVARIMAEDAAAKLDGDGIFLRFDVAARFFKSTRIAVGLHRR